MLAKNERRKNCAVFHEKCDGLMKMVDEHNLWINGNGKRGAKEDIASLKTEVKILLGMSSGILLAVVAVLFRIK